MKADDTQSPKSLVGPDRPNAPKKLPQPSEQSEQDFEPIASLVNRASAMIFDALVARSQSLTFWLVRGHEPDLLSLGLAAAGLSSLKRRGKAFEGFALLGAAATLAWLSQKPAKLRSGRNAKPRLH